MLCGKEPAVSNSWPLDRAKVKRQTINEPSWRNWWRVRLKIGRSPVRSGYTASHPFCSPAQTYQAESMRTACPELNLLARALSLLMSLIKPSLNEKEKAIS
jgi:hypothetical protein